MPPLDKLDCVPRRTDLNVLSPLVKMQNPGFSLSFRGGGGGRARVNLSTQLGLVPDPGPGFLSNPFAPFFIIHIVYKKKNSTCCQMN